MSDDDAERGRRNLVFTIDVIVASALAREDMAALRAAAAPGFRFRLLAASDTETPRFPRGGWRDDQQLLSVTITEGVGELRLVFNAIGFAALVRLAGRNARLVSADRSIDCAFRFDSNARGLVALADTPEIRRAATDVTVMLE